MYTVCSHDIDVHGLPMTWASTRRELAQTDWQLAACSRPSASRADAVGLEPAAPRPSEWKADAVERAPASKTHIYRYIYIYGNAIQQKLWSYRKMWAKASREKKTRRERREKERKKRLNSVMQINKWNAKNIKYSQLLRIPETKVSNAMHTNTPRAIVETAQRFP